MSATDRTRVDGAALLGALDVLREATAADLRSTTGLNGARFHAALRALGDTVQRRAERSGRASRFVYSRATLGPARDPSSRPSVTQTERQPTEDTNP